MIIVTNVTPAQSPVATDIHDIKPPVEIASGWEWLWWAVGALTLAGVAFVVWKLWSARRQKPLFVAEIPPHERARRKLEAALDFFDQPKPFCILVSDAVRLYLEERFELRAPDRTTEEFLVDLKRTSALDSAQKELLEQFLSACDLVKFARYEPGRPELEGLYNAALRLIEETSPEEAQRTEPKTEEAQPA